MGGKVLWTKTDELLAQGHKTGLKEGKIEGIKEGIKEGTILSVLKMLQKGTSLDVAAMLSDLQITTVQKADQLIKNHSDLLTAQAIWDSASDKEKASILQEI